MSLPQAGHQLRTTDTLEENTEQHQRITWYITIQRQLAVRICSMWYIVGPGSPLAMRSSLTMSRLNQMSWLVHVASVCIAIVHIAGGCLSCIHIRCADMGEGDI